MRKIKVCEVIPTLGMGGAETVVKDYLLNIDKSVFDVELLCIWGRVNSANERALETSNVRIRYLSDEVSPFGGIKSILNKLYRHLFINRYIWNYLDEYKPDIIHAHLIGYKTLKAIVSRERDRDLSIILSIHTDGAVAFHGTKDKEKLKGFIQKNPNIILTVLDRKTEKMMNTLFPCNQSIRIKNPVNDEVFVKSKRYRSEIRNELGIPDSSLVIGHVGRFQKVKNHSFIINIFVSLLSVAPNSYLVLVGDGKLQANIKEMVRELGCSNNVRFLSNRDDVYRILNGLDVFVFPSLYEGFPVSLIEAQCIGLKCVISDRINRECILSDKVIVKRLEDNTNYWVDSILYSNDFVSKEGNISDYYINTVISDVQNIYYKEYFSHNGL